MSDAKWTTVNGVRYPVDGCDTTDNTSETDNTSDIDPEIERQNKEMAISMFERWGEPMTSTTIANGGPKRTSSPPQKVPSPERLKQQETTVNESITTDNFMEFVEGMKPAMDESNRAAADVWTQQGTSAMLQHIMTREDGTQMSYAESRARYG